MVTLQPPLPCAPALPGDVCTLLSCERRRRRWPWLLLPCCLLTLSPTDSMAQPAKTPSGKAGSARNAKPSPDLDEPGTPPPRSKPAPSKPAPSKPSPAEAKRQNIRPPVLIQRDKPIYPAGESGRGVVVMKVLVERNGHVGEVQVVESVEHHVDTAAVNAVRKWLFRPATRAGKPIKSYIRVRLTMEPPPPSLPYRTPSKPVPPKPPVPVDSAPEEPVVLDVDVSGDKPPRSDSRGASDFKIDRDVLNAAPSQEGADMLRRAPGLYIGRPEGLAVAHRYMLRGFDADHGQDIAFRVGGLPINLPAHIHGQGYADLGFLVGEAVDELRISEGVYDPRQGDFAVAGSIDIDLGTDKRGWLIKSGYGAFNTFRQLAMWAPQGAQRETFGAVQYNRTDGFGQNRGGQGASALFQARLGEGTWSFRPIGLLHAARAQMAGVLRADDVAAGNVGFFDSYPYPTAQQQNALSARVMLGFFADYKGTDGSNGQLGAWLGYDTFRIQQNFTGFVQTSQTLAGVTGRGDLIEQLNHTTSAGLTGRYRSKRYEPFTWARGTLEAGFDARIDVINQAQNLLDATVRNQTWDERIDAEVRGGDIGLWADLDWSLSDYVRARVGVRADALFYDVEDRLGNFVPETRPEDAFIVGFRRSAFGVAAGPRASLAVMPLPWLSVRAAYGEGYRSPQARTLEDGERAPFTKVRSADLGVKLNWDKRLTLTLAGYFTQLSDDVAFEAREGRLERIGATRRLGAVLHAESRPLPWLISSFSLTVVDAELLEPPPPTADEPQPPFEKGQNLPFVPPVVGRLDMGARRRLTEPLGPHPLIGRLGTGFTFLSQRPLPFGERAAPVGLLDAGAGLSWGPVGLGFDMFNLLGAEYAAIEYNFPSDWSPTTPRSRLPARHTAAGSPRSWMATLEVSL